MRCVTAGRDTPNDDAMAWWVSPARKWRTTAPNAIRILTWGGLRGGISVALALSLPPSPEKQLILSCTYVVVLFSILVQGMTIKKVLAKYSGSDSRMPFLPMTAEKP